MKPERREVLVWCKCVQIELVFLVSVIQNGFLGIVPLELR